MKVIEYILSKKDTYNYLKEEKYLKNTKELDFNSIKRKMKLKPNSPKFYSINFELNNNYKIYLQHNNDDEFPEYSAILMLDKIRLCRLDYHDSHRRNCKKEIFKNLEYNELHLHLYCKECIENNLKYDSFVIDIDENRLNPFDFETFCELFCKITNIKYKHQRSLF